MTDAEIIDRVLAAEGGYVDDPRDGGGPTKYGITAAALGAYRDLGRTANRQEVKALTVEEAKAIYRRRYIIGPGFVPERVPYDPLRVQLVDFGVNSGPARAVRWLQRVCRVPVTGVLDAPTVQWLHAHAGYLWLVNDALVAARLSMLDAATDSGTVSKAFEEGLESRALSFLVTQA